MMSVKFTDAEITGTINALSGEIGGFDIAHKRIGTIADPNLSTGDGLAIYEDFIKLSKRYTQGNPPNSYAWAGIGTNVSPSTLGGTSAVGRFENHKQDGYWQTESITYYTYSSYQSAGSPTPATFYYTVWDDQYESTSHTETRGFYIPPDQMNYYFTYGGYLNYIVADIPVWQMYSWSKNYGIIIDVAEAAENIGIDILSGVIAGLAIKAKQISAGYTLTQEDVYVSCYNTSTITVYLPPNPQTGKIIFVHRVNEAGITVNGNGKTIQWGSGSGSSINTGGGDGRGDTGVYVFDGQYWMYNYLVKPG